MKKTIITIIIIAIIGVVVGGIATYSAIFQDKLGGGTESRVNQMGNITSAPTSTGSYCSTCPVKLLDLNTDRRYAIIQNLSDTDIYLYVTTTDLGINLIGPMIDPITGETGPTKSATSTEMFNIGSPRFSGILLEANGQPLSQIVFGPDNMAYGHVWATSSAASKQIQVNYK